MPFKCIDRYFVASCSCFSQFDIFISYRLSFVVPSYSCIFYLWDISLSFIPVRYFLLVLCRLLLSRFFFSLFFLLSFVCFSFDVSPSFFHIRSLLIVYSHFFFLVCCFLLFISPLNISHFIFPVCSLSFILLCFVFVLSILFLLLFVFPVRYFFVVLLLFSIYSPVFGFLGLFVLVSSFLRI